MGLTPGAKPAMKSMLSLTRVFRSRQDLAVLLVLFAVLAVLPVFVGGDRVVMHLLILCLIWAIVAAAWDLMMGFAGIFTFGQVAFFVVGAYASAILSMNLGVVPWLSMPIAAVVAAAVGVLIALPCLRLKGAYVALATFALHMILEPLIKSDIGRAIGTGGSQGMIGIPPLAIGDYQFNSMDRIPWFYTALVLALVALVVIYRIIHSRWGLAFIAVRDSTPFARSLGIDDFRYRLLVFGASAFITGFAGAFYAHYVSVLSTRILGLDLFLMLMVMLVIGGLGRFPGAVFGAFITVFLDHWLQPLDTWRPVIFGAIVVVLVVGMPGGVVGLLMSGSDRLRRRPRRDGARE